MRPVVLDLECFYDPKNLRGDPTPYTLSTMTTESYVRDARFEAHGAAIKWDATTSAQWYDERELRYQLAQEDWSDVFLIAHHMQFDGLILSNHYNVHPAMLGCTMSMSRLMLGNHIGVSLDSVRGQFGIPQKITPYNLMAGKYWREMDQYTREQVAAGAIDEVESIWKIFYMLMHRGFPIEELEIVDSTIKMFVESELIGDSNVFAKVWQDEIGRKKLVADRLGITPKELGSDDRFAELLRARGVEPETKVTDKGNTKFAFAKTDPFMEELQNDEDDEVRALAEARLGAKSTLLQTRAETLGWMASRGPLCVYLRYAGALTSRWSGGDDTNFQNWTNGSEINSAIVAPDGWLIAEPDLSQVECIAHGQIVLTDYGPKAIQDVQLADKVWDGIEWVTHEGVVLKGTKQVICYQGLTCTPDHLVYVRSSRGEEKMEMRVAAALKLDLARSSAPASVRQKALRKCFLCGLQNLWRSRNKIQIQVGTRSSDLGCGAPTASGLCRGRDRSKKQRWTLRTWKFAIINTARECQQSVYHFLGACSRSTACYAGLQTGVPTMWVRSRPDKSACRTWSDGRTNFGTLSKRTLADDVEKTKATRHWARTRFEAEKIAQKGNQTQTAKVYDIVNAGPRHRFTVSGILVSNCRLLNFCAGQEDKIEEFRQGKDPYVSVASAFYGYPVNKDDHPVERQLGKIVELQAGYMSGGNKIRSTVRVKSGGKIILTPAQGVEARDAYRDTHLCVVEYWNEARRVIERMANWESFDWGPFRVRCDPNQKTRRVVLPNGIQLIYDTLEFFTNAEDGERYWRLKTRKGWVKIYSGKLVENVIQALARVVVSQAMIRLKKLGYRCKNTKHDSLWLLVPKNDGRLEEHKATILREMSRTPDWLPGVPLASEFKMIGDRYS